MKQNNLSYLKEENLLTLFSLNNMVVPEIQREYVWGDKPDILEAFLNDIKQKSIMCDKCHHAYGSKNINVGFLYSYKPPYTMFENSRYLDEYLIDGQQRITTLFLLLLWRATVENRLDDFISIIRFDDSVNFSFNYKVRTLTQHFVCQLILHLKEEGANAINGIFKEDYPYWILSDYQNDPTIKSMLSALESIVKIFNDEDAQYFDYIISNIRFWHFKTEATSQGEELYITMNSRGEQLSDNEMTKSRILPYKDLVEYGTEWEEWQNLFWLKRDNNENADKGFNFFLSSIESLEKFINPNVDECPKFEDIKQYIKGLIYINRTEFKDTIKDKCGYTNWFDSFISELWEKINTDETKWHIPNPKLGNDEKEQYNNSSTTRNLSMIFWPWMLYFKILKEKRQNVDDDSLIQLLHFYYVRYHCYKRSSTTIQQIVENMMNKTAACDFNNSKIENEDDDTDNTIYSKEEIILYNLINNRKEIESLIWEIQDLPYFRDGRDVGGNTILKYVDGGDDKKGLINGDNIQKSLEIFMTNIKALLGNKTEDTAFKIKVKQILLFYKNDNSDYDVAFWEPQSPYYYNNYETSSWKRIVRHPYFVQFISDYFVEEKIENIGEKLDDILKDKREKFFNVNNVINRYDKQWSHRKLAILYDLLAGGIWDSTHKNIAFWPIEESCDDNKNKIFYRQDTLWRANRYYDSNSEISLPGDWQDRLKEHNVEINE